MMNGKRAIGEIGEERAAAYLRGCGWEIVVRNYHTTRGEADLICRDGTTLVFVEVKYRRGSAFGSALESVTPKKLARCRLAAEEWLQKNGCEDAVWRIDAIAIDGETLEHFENVS